MGVRWIRAAALAVTIFVAGVAAGAALQQQAGGTRREPQFENEHVRVWKSIIMPNQPLTLHRHEHGGRSLRSKAARSTSSIPKDRPKRR